MKAHFGLFLICLLLAGPYHGDEVELFVSPTGDDSNAGTKDKPFQTLEKARDTLRKIKGDREAVVWLGGGVYELNRTFDLNVEDSGSIQNPVTWSAQPGEEVRIVGGKVVTGWKPVTDEPILARLAPEARGKVLQVDLKALGITAYGQVQEGGLELFYNDQPMTLARWPNQGFVKITGLAGPGDIDVRGAKGSTVGKFMYEGDEPKRWVGEKDIWLHGFWCWDWADEREKVESIDTDRHIISVAPPYHIYGYRVGQWFYATNILAELDSPGEWYLDRDTGILYFWPPTPIEQGRAVVSVLDKLADLTDVSHVTLEGMIFEAARGTGISIKGGSQDKVAGCVLRNLGSWGVIIDDATDSGVVGCHIYQTGNGGIGLNGVDIYQVGNIGIGRKTLTPSGLFADNNEIDHYGRWNHTHQTGISIGGDGNRATHNLIHDAPYIAIEFSGNDHLIEFNEIHHVCEETNDAGAIYAGHDWTMRGTMIRNNYLHDLSGFEQHGCDGVYLDDAYCGTTISGNVFYQVSGAILIGGGRDNLIENNLFVDCKSSLTIDGRGLNWASDSVNTTMRDRLNAMPYQSDLWQKRYPELVNILKDTPAAPKGNVVIHNIFLGGKWDDIYDEARKYVTLTDNLVDKPPLFDEDQSRSFLRQTASLANDIGLSARGMGFKPIPFEKIGRYDDKYRKELPPKVP